MIQKRIEDINAQDLDALISGGVREGKTIEYKKELTISTDKEKKEFLADVSSFANASGGDLIIGVRDLDAVPQEIMGLAGFNADKDILRVENIIRDGIDPRVPGIRSVAVPHPKGAVLLVRVPKSWTGPHMVSFQDNSRFYSRTSNGKFQLDVHELRAAFGLSADVPARIRSWRTERLSRILTGDTPVSLVAGGKAVLHVAPVEAFTNPFRIKASSFAQDAISEFGPLGLSGYNSRINVDGFVTYGGGANNGAKGETGYCQVFRSGLVETVTTSLVREFPRGRVIASMYYEMAVLETVAAYLRALQKREVQPPIAIMMTFLDVKNAFLGIEQRLADLAEPIDRETLLLPDIVLEEWPTNLPKKMRPIFDGVWNACGFPQSLNFGADGRWNGDSLRNVPNA